MWVNRRRDETHLRHYGHWQTPYWCDLPDDAQRLSRSTFYSYYIYIFTHVFKHKDNKDFSKWIVHIAILAQPYVKLEEQICACISLPFLAYNYDQNEVSIC